MINQWWFRLYTKNYLIALLKVVPTCIAIDQAMAHFAGPFKYFAAFLAGIPVMLLFMKQIGGSLRANIEFHKMSVPFIQLKSAFLKDIFISVSATFLASILFILFSYLLGGVYSSEMGYALLTIIPPGVGIFFFVISFLMACYVLMLNKDRKYLLVERHPSRIKNFINTAGISLLFVLFVALWMLVFPSSGLIMFIAPSSIFIGGMLFHQKAIFHQYRPKGRLRDFTKFWGGGSAICLSLYFLCIIVSRQDVLNTNLNATQRAGSFEFNNRYNPAIDIETFRIIENHVSFESKQDLYESLEFDPSALGVEFYLDKKDEYSTSLGYMLRYGKPSPEFLIVLYDHFEKNPEYWKTKKNFPMVQYAAFSKWPKKEKLPERFIVAKQSSRDLYKKDATERMARAKARRELASKQED